MNKLHAAEKQLNRVIRGKETVIRNLLIAVAAGGNVLLDDVPGVGKTTLVKALAKLLDVKFARVQFTPDLLPADLMGSSVYNPQTGEFTFREGPVFTNLFLADEINRASPRTQSALLECMCEHQLSADGICRKLEPPFFVIATQNPIEHQGTYPLPEAQLDRFDMQLSLGYPDEKAEKEMLADRYGKDPLEDVQIVFNRTELLELQKKCSAVLVSDCAADYLLKLIRATRQEGQLLLGASPRASLRLLECAKAAALFDDRDFVIPDDIRALAQVVLPHRLVMENNSRYSGITPAEIIAEIIRKTPMPK